MHVFLLDGSRASEPAHHLGPVSQQEEQDVNHDEEIDQAVERILPNAQSLAGKELRAPRQGRRQPLLEQTRTAQAKAIEQGRHRRRQGRVNLLQVQAKIDLTGLNPLIHLCTFADQHARQPGQWQQNQQNDQHQAGQGREIAPPGQRLLQARLQRRKQDRKGRRPKQGSKIWLQDPGESQAHGHQKHQERLVFERGALFRRIVVHERFRK